MQSTVACRALDAEAFAEFGEVVSTDNRRWRPANDGRAQRYSNLVRLEHSDAAARPEVSIYRVQASTLPMMVSGMERHPHSSQLFMPVSGGRYLVVVCKAGAAGQPDPSTLAAFIANPKQGIAYRPGTWHLPIAALGEAAEFLMFMWEGGPADDCEAAALEHAVLVTGDAEF